MTDPEPEITDPVALADRSWIAVQQNTFTNWCNDRLKGSGVLVEDLVTDLDDGVKLIVLLKRISFKRVCAKYYQRPRLPVHRSENLEKAFRFMTDEEKLHLVNIGPQDVIQHNQKIILGLIWHLILRYQIFGGQPAPEQEKEGVKKKPHKKPPAKKILLKWLQSQMPPSLPVKNLSSDWNDGKHLSALVDSMKPGLIPDYETQVPSDALHNTQNAMDIAEEKFGIPKVIKPEHLCVEQPDELSVMTYLSYFCSGHDSPGHSSLLAWVREQIPEYNIQNFTTDWNDGKALSALVNALADGSMPNHAELDPDKGVENVRNAIKAAEENLDGIAAYMSPEDFATDSLTMMGYIGSFRKATPKRRTPVTSPGVTGEEGPVTVSVHVTSHAVPSVPSSSVSEAPASPFTTEIAVKPSPPPRTPSPVQGVEHSSVVEAAQPVWPEDMSHTMQKPPDEGDHEGKPADVGARQQAVLKAAELHKKFQEIVQWEAGKDFEKEEKKKFVEEADAEYKAFLNDPITKFSVPSELTEQRKEALKHWENLCSMVDAEEQAEQTLQELQDLNSWVKGCLSDLDSQPPLADTLEGVQKQKEWHQMFMTKFSAKRQEIQKHASLSVITYTEGLLDVIKKEHAALGKGRSQLMRKWQDWGKLLDACIAAWEKCSSTKDKLRQLEEQHAKWGPPAENQDILDQFHALQTFQTSRVVPFKSEVSAMTDLEAHLKSLGGHPPVVELCRCVTERYDWLVSSVDMKHTATQECCRMARDFEQIKQPFEAWITKAESDVNGLLQQASDSKRLLDAKENLEGIQKAAKIKENDVSALSDLSLKFAQSREPILGEISEYHSKLQSITPSPVSMAAIREGTTKKHSATPSIAAQASDLERKWEWILDQSIALPACYPEKVVVEGIPQGTLKVGQQYRLQADISNAGDGELMAELSGPTKSQPCTVEETHNKGFDILFTPEEPGKHKVDILFADTAIPLSPLVFDVVDPALVKVTPPSPNVWGVFTTNEPCAFHIKCPTRTEQITATAQGRRNAKEFGIPVQDLGGGEYNAILTTPTPDTYDVKFYYSGHLVSNCPFLLPVEEKPNPDRVTCMSYVSQIDGKVCVEADTSRAGTGKLSATAQGDIVGAVVCKTENEGAGKWVVTFNPPLPDVYTVHVYWNDIDVPCSPFTISNIQVDASKVKVEGPHSNKTPVSAICDTSEAGEGTLSAKCTSTRFGDVLVQVDSAENHKQSVLFTPPGKDQYSLSILWDGMHVPDSPFHINLNQPDASMVKVDGPHPCAEGTGPVRTLIDTSEAGDGMLSAKCTSTRFGDVPIDVSAPENHKQSVLFTPPGKDHYSLSILWDGMHVPDSPFHINLNQPDASVVKVDGPHPCAEGTGQVRTLIDTSEAGDGVLSAKCTSTRFGDVPVQVDSAENHKQSVVFSPHGKDHYSLSILWDGMHVPDSPFHINLNQPDASMVKVDGPHPCAEGTGQVRTLIDTSEAGDGLLSAKCTSTRFGDVPVQVDSAENHKQSVLFSPPGKDHYSLSILWDGMHVPDSPFHINLNQPDASMVKVDGPHPCAEGAGRVSALIDTSEAGNGVLSAKCTSTRFGDVPIDVSPAENHKQSVLFTPPGKDHYSLSILWDGMHIPDSPFHINLNQPDASMVKVDGPHPCAGETSLVRTLIDTSEAGDSDLQVACEEGGAPVEVTLSEDQPGHYTAMFEATTQGTYIVAVTFGDEPVPYSPFSVLITRSQDEVAAAVVEKQEVEEVYEVEPMEVVEASYIPEGFVALGFEEEGSIEKEEASPEPYPVFGPGTPLCISVENEDKDDMHTSIKAKCTGERVGKIPAKVTTSSDGERSVSISPRHPDLYTLEIKVGKEHIPGSPFIVRYAYPPPVASKCKVNAPPEDDKWLTREEIVYYVDATEAGYGELTIENEGPSVATRPSKVKITPPAESEARYKVVYVPTAPGVHKHNILWSGESVPGSPLTFVVEQHSRPLYAWGPVSLSYTSASSTPKNISGYVEHQTTKKRLRLRVKEDLVFNGTYHCTFVPKNAGVHEVYINSQKKPVQGSPFEVIVLEPPRVDKVVVRGLDKVRCAVGKPLRFTVDCTEAGSGNLLVRSEGPSDPSKNAQLELVDNKDNTFACTFIPTAIGTHQIYMQWGGEPVRQTPFTLEAVSSQRLELGDVELGNPIQVGVFDDPRDSLSALAVGERTGDAPVTIIQDEFNTQSVLFTPLFEDDYTLSIFLNGSHVDGSPYHIRVPSAVLEPVYTKEPTPEDVVVKEEKYILPELETSALLQMTSTDEEGLGMLSFHQTSTPKEPDGDHSKVYIVPDDLDALSKPFEMSQLCTFHVNTYGAGSGTLDVVAQGPAKATISIEDSEKYGVQQIQCVPSKPGEYRLDIHWNDTPLEESPLIVNFHHELVKTGLDLSVVPFYIGRPYKFKTLCEEVGEGELVVDVTPPSAATVNVRDVGTNAYMTTISPLLEGQHKISVTHDGQHLHGSPFSVLFMHCSDASKCCLVEEDQTMEGGKICFMVDTTGAGAGELTAEVLSMQEKVHIPCEVEAARGNSYWICFMAKQDVAEYLVSIKYDGAHIPRSPFQLVLSDQAAASACRVEGQGLRYAEVNKESQFVVFTDCTDADVKVKIEGTSETLFPSLRQLEGGVHEFTYTAQFEGEYQIDVLYNGDHIPGSPFIAKAHHPSNLPKIGVDRNSIQHAVSGCPITCDIRSLDVPCDADLTLTAYRGHEAVNGKINFEKEGLFRGTFTPPKSGNYIVHSCWEGKDVLGSPFHVRVSDPPVPDNVKASGPGLLEGVVGSTCEFRVNTTDAGAATLVVEVMGPKGPVKANIKRNPKEKRSVDASFVPLRPGEYTISVLWAGTNILGSPFKMHVSPPRREQSV